LITLADRLGGDFRNNVRATQDMQDRILRSLLTVMLGYRLRYCNKAALASSPRPAGLQALAKAISLGGTTQPDNRFFKLIHHEPCHPDM
jgi:hypothetical protein